MRSWRGLAVMSAVDGRGHAAGQLIGSVIAGWDGWRCHLYRLAVRPTWRRRGAGSALLQAAEDRFKALAATRVDAMVPDSNELGQDQASPKLRKSSL